jgi:hypothetical protein
MTQKCTQDGCKEEGTFPAPRDPRNIGERQYFCAEHIKEFNKKWNGLDGFNEDEIFSMQQTATWNRPTWKAGVNGDSPAGEGLRFKTTEELYHFFKARHMEQKNYSAAQKKAQPIPPDVHEACVIFAIDAPTLSLVKLKQQYIALVKQHHPDVNRGSKTAEDMVKRINVAYHILRDYAAK